MLSHGSGSQRRKLAIPVDRKLPLRTPRGPGPSGKGGTGKVLLLP